METRPELVGKRFLCVAAGEDARPERGQSGCGRGWRAGVIRAVSHRDRGHPDLAVRAGGQHVARPSARGGRAAGGAGGPGKGSAGCYGPTLPGKTILRLAFQPETIEMFLVRGLVEIISPFLHHFVFCLLETDSALGNSGS